MIEARGFHVFSKDGQHYLFLAQPVAIFKIDASTADVVTRMETGAALQGDEQEQRWQKVQDFIAGYCAKRPAAKVMRRPEDITDKVMGIYLFVSQECNLKCSYCYGDEGEYGKRGRMGEHTMEQAMETFFSRGQGSHFLIFFGGEPLMNFPLMKKTAALAESYREEGKGDIGFGIVTNGTFCNPEIKEFFDNHIVDATFSLDGPGDLNDGQRISKDSRSVFRTAQDNIRALTAGNRFNWAFRSIVTAAGHDRVAEIYDTLEQFGPGGIGIVNVDVPKDSPLHLDDEQYQKFVAQVTDINRKGLRSFIEGEQAVAFEYPFYVLYHFVSRSHALYHCNAGTNLLAVTAEGDVYPCHRFVGEEAFRMGNVADPELRSSERFQGIRQQFVDATVDNRPGCQDCWARYLCGGACAKYSYAEHGDMRQPVDRHCYYMKTVIENILPDIVSIISDPQARSTLSTRLQRAISNRHGSHSLDAAQPA